MAYENCTDAAHTTGYKRAKSGEGGFCGGGHFGFDLIC